MTLFETIIIKKKGIPSVTDPLFFDDKLNLSNKSVGSRKSPVVRPEP